MLSVIFVTVWPQSRTNFGCGSDLHCQLILSVYLPKKVLLIFNNKRKISDGIHNLYDWLGFFITNNSSYALYVEYFECTQQVKPNVFSGCI